MKNNYTNLIGKVYERLTILEICNAEKGIHRKAICKCSCGNIKSMTIKEITSGKSKSCGCLGLENRIISRKIHGLSNTRLYTIFAGMKSRCYRTNFPSYKWYGAKGIKICDEWLNDFTKFIEWSYVNNYNDSLTIDRKNNDKDYCPENCQWVTKQEQYLNRSTGGPKGISGINGVSWHSATNKWRVRLTLNNKTISLGYFDTIEEATKVRKEAEKKYFKN